MRHTREREREGGCGLRAFNHYIKARDCTELTKNLILLPFYKKGQHCVNKLSLDTIRMGPNYIYFFLSMVLPSLDGKIGKSALINSVIRISSHSTLEPRVVCSTFPVHDIVNVVNEPSMKPFSFVCLVYLTFFFHRQFTVSGKFHANVSFGLGGLMACTSLEF